MARILAISSQVAQGTVGLSIIVPALQALGHEVVALPTVLLSNHPGHAHTAGARIDPAVLSAMLAALGANGWLGAIDGVLTGYLPSAAHVAFAHHAVVRTRAANPACIVLCDPVLGDDPKGLYIDEDAASAIREILIPLATITTPNRFELSYLARSEIHSVTQAARVTLPGDAAIVATSIPGGRERVLCNILHAPEILLQTRVPRRANVPHGTGDLFSALMLSAVLNGEHLTAALAFSTAGVDMTLAASAGNDQLLVGSLPTKAGLPEPWPVVTL